MQAQSTSVDELLFRRLPTTYKPDKQYAIKQHVLAACKEYNDLVPRSETYNDGTGFGTEVLALAGTLPMLYQGVTYNIPIKVFLPRAYPSTAPHLFVTPTPEMEIKASHSCTSPSGRFVSQYLRNWTFPRSNLVDALTDASEIFGAEPPVHSRPVAAYVPPPSPATPPPFQNPLNNNPLAGFLGFVAGTLNQGRPPPPPQQPHSGAAGGGSAHVGYPERPPQPPPARNGAVGYPQSAGGAAVGTAGAAGDSDAVDEAALEREFRDAALAALEARVLASVEASTSGLAGQAAALEETKKELLQRQEVLRNGVLVKKQELTGLERNVSRLSRASQDLERWLQANEHKAAAVSTSLRPDEVVVPADSLSRQAIDAQAQDMAIEDQITVFDKALKAGSIEVGVYVKQLRLICQQQYMARLLGARVQQQQQQLGRAYGGGGLGGPAVALPQGDTWASTAVLANPMTGMRLQ